MTILIIIQILVIGFLGIWLVNTKKEKIIREIEERATILPNPAKEPDFKEVDPDYKLLKDVIESIKMENWKVSKFEIGYSGKTYDIELINGTGTLVAKCRLDNYSKVEVGKFSIHKMFVNKDFHSHVITYKNGDDKKLEFLILNLMWVYVLDHHQNVYDKEIKYHLSCKLAIEGELKTLKRDKTLENLLES